MTNSQYHFRRKLSLSLLLVLLCLPLVGLAQSNAQNNYQGTIKRVTFKDVRVNNALATLGKQMDIEVVIDDSVQNSRVNIDLENVTLDAALKTVLAQKHLQACLLEDKKAVVFSDDEANRQRFDQYKAWPEAALAPSVEQGQEVDSIKQTVMFKDTSVKAALATLGKQLKMNVVYDDSVKDSRITIELPDVTLRAAIKVILVQQHLQARLIEDKTIIIIQDTETNRQRYEQHKEWPNESDKK